MFVYWFFSNVFVPFSFLIFYIFYDFVSFTFKSNRFVTNFFLFFLYLSMFIGSYLETLKMESAEGNDAIVMENSKLKICCTFLFCFGWSRFTENLVLNMLLYIVFTSENNLLLMLWSNTFFRIKISNGGSKWCWSYEGCDWSWNCNYGCGN